MSSLGMYIILSAIVLSLGSLGVRFEFWQQYVMLKMLTRKHAALALLVACWFAVGFVILEALKRYTAGHVTSIVAAG